MCLSKLILKRFCHIEKTILSFSFVLKKEYIRNNARSINIDSDVRVLYSRKSGARPLWSLEFKMILKETLRVLAEHGDRLAWFCLQCSERYGIIIKVKDVL